MFNFERTVYAFVSYIYHRTRRSREEVLIVKTEQLRGRDRLGGTWERERERERVCYGRVEEAPTAALWLWLLCVSCLLVVSLSSCVCVCFIRL